MKKLHLADAAGRDATVRFLAVRPPPGARPALHGQPVAFQRYLAATEQGLDEALTARLGHDYGQALVDGDPELDLEAVGRRIGPTDVVFLSSEGGVLYAPPRWVEVVLDPSGEERSRRAPVDQPANVADEAPVRWTPRRMKRAEAVRRYAFGRTVQLRHADGLTCDYLHAMAAELDEADEVVLLGAGPKGRDPLIFQTNGSPYRGFLEGRVDGPRYQLLLHLSNLELKDPGGDA